MEKIRGSPRARSSSRPAFRRTRGAGRPLRRGDKSDLGCQAPRALGNRWACGGRVTPGLVATHAMGAVRSGHQNFAANCTYPEDQGPREAWKRTWRDRRPRCSCTSIRVTPDEKSMPKLRAVEEKIEKSAANRQGSPTRKADCDEHCMKLEFGGRRGTNPPEIGGGGGGM